MSTGSALAAWLYGLDNAHLARVLVARADAVAAPEPRSVGEVADRLQRPASVAMALPRLALPCVQVAEALAALGAPASRDDLASLLGVRDGADARGLDTALETLADHALVWPDDAGLLHTATPLRQAWNTPLGLEGPLARLLADATSDDLRGMLMALGIKPPGPKRQRLAALQEHHSDPRRVAASMAQAPRAARDLLEHQADHPPLQPGSVFSGDPGAGSPPGVAWAVERGLLVQDRYGYGPALMPSEVALALRGRDWHAPFDPTRPAVRLAPVTPAEVDREAAAAATVFAAHVSSVLAVCATSPPARLKSGGVGARELGRIGRAARCDEIVVRVALEGAYAVGLLAYEGDHVSATDAYDTWVEQEPADQLSLLLRAWWELPLTPSPARDEDGKALPALAGNPPCDGCLQARHALLTAASQLPAGQGVESPPALGPVIAWQRPLVHQLPQDSTPFATAIRESELLGVLARGALSPIGAALLADDPEGLGSACRRLVPAASGTTRIGADLTAVVTGTPAARLVALLDSVADREASGTASVWRFTPRTVRRALDAGRTPDEIVADLAAVAVGPLPQPLSYLITDAARSHGRIRVASAACVIHGQEPALLAELAAHRGLSKLGLRQLAPTVLISGTALDKTLAALRAEGYAAVAETADGTVRIEQARRHRAAAALPGPRLPISNGTCLHAAARTAGTPPSVDVSALAARLTSAPPTSPEPDPYNGVPFDSDTEEIVAGYGTRLSLTDVRQLAHAIHEDQAVTIEYVAASGSHTVRTLSRLDFDPPYLQAWCHLRKDERVFALSRIHGVMPA